MVTIEKNKMFFDLLEKSIISVENISTNVVFNENFKIGLYKNKFSNLDYGSITLFMNNKPLKSKDFKINYICECGNHNKIHLVKFLKKKYFRCVKCRETEEKRKNHSNLLKSENFKKKEIKINKFDINEEIKTSNKLFINESQKFKEKYFTKNLTIDEFLKFKPNIVSIKNINVEKLNFIFEPHIRTNNQSKYSQYVILNDEKILLTNIKFKCDNCFDIFNTTRKLKTKIDNHKILCPKCSFCNKIFKIKKYKTKFNDDITYQSNLEMFFIKQCEKNNIRILNGHTIPYSVNNKIHKYRIDFHLPEYDYMIEIKGNHIWHRNQLKTGIWAEKEKNAINYCVNIKNTYKILFQEDIDDFMTSIKI